MTESQHKCLIKSKKINKNRTAVCKSINYYNNDDALNFLDDNKNNNLLAERK